MPANGPAKIGLTLDVDCRPMPAYSWPMRGGCARSCSTFCPTPSNSRRAAAASLLSGRIVGEDVQIAVADNGPGLSPDVKANVFERFSAKSQAGTRAGAGLGLALVNRFLELHDGWVEIESEQCGTLVRCHLPAPHPRRRAASGSQRGSQDGVSDLVLDCRHDRTTMPSSRRAHAQLAGQAAVRLHVLARNPAWFLPCRLLGGSFACHAGST